MDQYGIESEVVTVLVNEVSDVSRSNKDRTNVETLAAKQYQHLVKVVRQRFFNSVNAACKGRNIPFGRWSKGRSATNDVCVVHGSVRQRHMCKTAKFQFSSGYGGRLASACEQNFLVSKINDALAKEIEDILVEDNALDGITKWTMKDELVSKSKPLFICQACVTQIFQLFVENNRNCEQLVRRNESFKSA